MYIKMTEKRSVGSGKRKPCTFFNQKFVYLPSYYRFLFPLRDRPAKRTFHVETRHAGVMYRVELHPLCVRDGYCCCYSYKRTISCSMSRGGLRAKLTLSNLKGVWAAFKAIEVMGDRNESYASDPFSFISANPCTSRLHVSLLITVAVVQMLLKGSLLTYITN